MPCKREMLTTGSLVLLCHARIFSPRSWLSTSIVEDVRYSSILWLDFIYVRRLGRFRCYITFLSCRGHAFGRSRSQVGRTLNRSLSAQLQPIWSELCTKEQSFDRNAKAIALNAAAVRVWLPFLAPEEKAFHFAAKFRVLLSAEKITKSNLWLIASWNTSALLRPVLRIAKVSINSSESQHQCPTAVLRS